MRTGKTSRGTKIYIALLTVAAVAGVTVSALYSAMREQAAEVCAYRARQAVNAIVAEEIADCGGKDGFLDITYRADGSVGSVSADVVKINALENELRGRINERLSTIEDKDVGVSIGSLTGIPFLNSRGFTVRMIFQVEGSAEVRLTGGLETAGINQTRHLLRLEVECSVIAQLPGYSERVETKGEYVVSETVIVGNVPSGFYSG